MTLVELIKCQSHITCWSSFIYRHQTDRQTVTFNWNLHKPTAEIKNLKLNSRVFVFCLLVLGFFVTKGRRWNSQSQMTTRSYLWQWNSAVVHQLIVTRCYSCLYQFFFLKKQVVPALIRLLLNCCYGCLVFSCLNVSVALLCNPLIFSTSCIYWLLARETFWRTRSLNDIKK